MIYVGDNAIGPLSYLIVESLPIPSTLPADENASLAITIQETQLMKKVLLVMALVSLELMVKVV